MTVEVLEQAKLTILSTAGELVRIVEKYRNGTLRGQGLPDAVSYAQAQIDFYEAIGDEESLSKWKSALDSTVSLRQNFEPLKQLINNEAWQIVKSDDVKARSESRGHALRNLADSF